MKSSTRPIRREYNQWVANETLEDYALRYTAKHSRKWSISRVANTALGVVSFLALEAIGGAITLNYGFINAFWAIIVVGIIIFFSGLPLAYYAARYGLDIDLLTRGAGFGYIGSTISSLIYASFTFIFFAIEAAIMSEAIQMVTGIPLSWAYVISAVLIIPLVTHGISRISFFQAWSQPIWLVLQILPLLFIASSDTSLFQQWIAFDGIHGATNGQFNILFFGSAAAVIFPLIAQNGEQVDFIRFLPHKKAANAIKWWFAVVAAGPGWVVIGVLKLLLGSFFTVLALQHGISADLADDPSHMYSIAFNYITHNPQWTLVLVGVFVVISQMKINVTNAYAGSIAWGNFFSRLTHNHPGRVVWLIFNVSIALLLMELGLYQVFDSILISYSSLVLAWIASVVADLIINKPLGLSPRHIEFRRGYLYDINPVGVGSMLIASSAGIAANIGLFGATIKALAAFIALCLPFILVPLLAWLTQGKYYLGRDKKYQAQSITSHHALCELCDNEFDREDMSYCPAYDVSICSLCCALDSRCGDKCRPQAHLSSQAKQWFGTWLPHGIRQHLQPVTVQFIGVFSFTSIVIGILLSVVYYSQQMSSISQLSYLSTVMWQVFFLLLLVTGVLIWLYVLAQNSNRQAFDETCRQAELLLKEINAHKHTAVELERARDVANIANQAKSRYLSSVSHELRTPLNTIFGYAQVMEANVTLDKKTRDIATVIRRSGEHLSDVLEGLLEISKIESRRLDLHKNSFSLCTLINELEAMFKPAADNKGLLFSVQCDNSIPDYISGDEKRIRQILLNLLSNAVKFTQHGSVSLTASYRSQVAYIVVKDTGPGIEQQYQDRIFEPFERIYNKQTSNIKGTGLGLAISRLLAELMGASLELKSEVSQGSEFRLRLFLPSVNVPLPKEIKTTVKGYSGRIRTIMVVDDEDEHRNLMVELLQPLGFNMITEAAAPSMLKRTDLKEVDLFLLDIAMPDIDGWQLLSELRGRGHQQPVIIVSANPYEMMQQTTETLQFDAYITKPLRRDKLLTQLQRLLQLQWLNTVAETTTSADIDSQQTDLPEAQLIAIKQQAEIGHLSGIIERLDDLESQYAHSPSFLELTQLARQCDMPAMIRFINNRIKA